MKLLILDPAGLALDLAVHVIQQGHDVVQFIQDTTKTNRIGENVVQRVRGNLDRHVKDADVVFVADTCKYMHTFEKLRELVPDKLWFGPDLEATKWEMDRKYGQDLLARYGIPVPSYQIFSDYDQAKAYVKKRDTRLVSKPFGGDQEDKSLSYVSKSPEDLLYMLDRWQKLGKLKNQFMLQDFIEGVEFGAEGWFDGEDWSGPWHEAFEHKKFMAGEIGPATGEMGTVNLAVQSSVLADKVLRPLTPVLKAAHFRGFFNVNCIVDSKGKAWPLEITPRPGWPCFMLQLSISRGDLLDDLYHNHAPKFKTGTVTTGVVLAHGDFPHSHLTRKEVTGIPVFGWDETNGHFHPAEMMKDRSGQWVTAGDYICVVTGHGRTVRDSMESAYQNLNTLIFPNSAMYRNDIGGKVEKYLPKLHKHGLAMGYRW